MKPKLHYKMTLVVLFLLFSCLLSAPALLAYTGTISDNFNDNNINTSLWQAFSSGTASVNEVNQQLEISLPGTSSGEAGYVSRCALRGDFDMQVDFTLLNWPSGNGTESGLELSTLPHRDNLIAGVGRSNLSSIDSYLSEIIGPFFGFAPTGDLSGKVRINRTGDTITSYYWDTVSLSWADILSHTDPVLAQDGVFDLVFGLNPDSMPGGFPVKMAFDNFQLQYDQLVCIPLPPTLLLLGSGLLGFGLPGLRRRMKQS
jgi:hypothetical protein